MWAVGMVSVEGVRSINVVSLIVRETFCENCKKIIKIWGVFRGD